MLYLPEYGGSRREERREENIPCTDPFFEFTEDELDGIRSHHGVILILVLPRLLENWNAT